MSAGDRHRHNPVAVRPSPEAWVLLDRRAAGAGKRPGQIVREIFAAAMLRELESLAPDHDKRVDEVLDRISALSHDEQQRLLGWLSSAVPDEVAAAIDGVIGLR